MRILSTLIVVAFSVQLEASEPLYNEAAYIPPQCYVKTQEKDDVFNPCFACHTDSKAPNFMNDGDTQLEFSFQKYPMRNRWSNLFKDKTKEVSEISDDEILEYVRSSNYLTEGGQISLSESYLKSLSKYDVNKNGQWDGYVPDSYFNFDQNGFDKAPDGSFTGWRSFLYIPFPGLFVPSAGSFGDVLIRLPIEFQQNIKGEFDIEVYQANLAIVESLIKQKDILTPALDETRMGVDLDRDGKLSTATRIKFFQNKVDGSGMAYVGLAGKYQAKGQVQLAAGLYPKHTEFLHSVRYLDVNNNSVVMAPRMKELRYAKKIGWSNAVFHEQFALAEAIEREKFPEQLLQVPGNEETGVLNGLGWKFQAFIEDKDGDLRPQSYEEHVFCVGCHSALGALDDSTFSFSRKVGYQTNKKDWGHWQEFSLGYIADWVEDSKSLKEYVIQNSAVDDYRQSRKEIGTDIINYLLPSASQALEMNKAYKTIVNNQSFTRGRDANTKPLKTVHRVIKPDMTTGIKTPIVHEK